jgi:poly-gamma-glutamate synthase PgsB/CapB
MYLARKLGCKYIVFECMAINPECQIACSRIVDPGITVITNAYPDHIYEMGESEVDTMENLLLSVPGDSTCVYGDLSEETLAEFKKECAERNIKPVACDKKMKIDAADFKYSVMPENVYCALKVMELLGFDLERSYRYMTGTSPEVGSFRYYRLKNGAIFANAFSANDVKSTIKLFHKVRNDYPCRKVMGLFNSRQDRPYRTLEFKEFLSDKKCFEKVFVIGDILGNGFRNTGMEKIRNISKVEENMYGDYIIFGFGNIRGLIQWIARQEVIK